MCLDKQGKYSVQVIIEMALTPEEEAFITSEIKGHIAELAIVHFFSTIRMNMVHTLFKKESYVLTGKTKKLLCLRSLTIFAKPLVILMEYMLQKDFSH